MSFGEKRGGGFAHEKGDNHWGLWAVLKKEDMTIDVL